MFCRRKYTFPTSGRRYVQKCETYKEGCIPWFYFPDRTIPLTWISVHLLPDVQKKNLTSSQFYSNLSFQYKLRGCFAWESSQFQSQCSQQHWIEANDCLSKGQSDQKWVEILGSIPFVSDSMITNGLSERFVLKTVALHWISFFESNEAFLSNKKDGQKMSTKY